MTTGRRLIQTALREPMTAAGWTPRRAGWFTVPVVPGSCSGSLATMTAVEHHAAGAAEVRWVAGFRDEGVEQEVLAVVGHVPEGPRPRVGPAYVERTVISVVSPGMTGRGSLSWTVDAASAAEVAGHMAHAADRLVLPWLHHLAQDRQMLAATAFGSRKLGPRCLARAAILARDTGDDEGARHLVQEAADSAVGENPGHAAMRAAVAALSPAVGR